MQRKKVTRTFEMTVESRERVTINKFVKAQTNWCVVCQRDGLFVPISEVARSEAISQRAIFRLIESGDIGFFELADRAFFICLECTARKRQDSARKS